MERIEFYVRFPMWQPQP